MNEERLISLWALSGKGKSKVESLIFLILLKLFKNGTFVNKNMLNMLSLYVETEVETVPFIKNTFSEFFFPFLCLTIHCLMWKWGSERSTSALLQWLAIFLVCDPALFSAKKSLVYFVWAFCSCRILNPSPNYNNCFSGTGNTSSNFTMNFPDCVK